MKIIVRYILPNREIRDVEGARPPRDLLAYVDLDGVRYGVADINVRPEFTGDVLHHDVHTLRHFVRLRQLTPAEVASLAPKPERPAPAPSPRHRIARMFVNHEDLSPSDDIVIAIRRGVPRDEWAKALRRLADAGGEAARDS